MRSFSAFSSVAGETSSLIVLVPLSRASAYFPDLDEIEEVHGFSYCFVLFCGSQKGLT